MDRKVIIIYFILFCFLIIGSLIIYKNLLMNKEENKWNVKSYNSTIEGLTVSGQGLTGNKIYPNNSLIIWGDTSDSKGKVDTSSVIWGEDYNEKFTCNYDFTATILLVAKGGNGGCGGGGGDGGAGGGWYYDPNFQFKQGYKYTISINDEYTYLNDGTSTIRCFSAIGNKGGGTTGSGPAYISSNGKKGNDGPGGIGNNDFNINPTKPNTVKIGGTNQTNGTKFNIGGAGGGGSKYASAWPGEYTKNQGYDNFSGKSSTTGWNSDVDAYSYGNGGGGCEGNDSNHFVGGAPSNGAIVIYYTAKSPAPTTPGPTTPKPTTPKPTTPAPTTPKPTMLPISKTKQYMLDKNEFYVIPLSEKDSGKINSNTSTVSGVNNKNILLYFPNGKYIFTASSTANVNSSPYMAFDGDLTTFWQCNTKGNNYKTDPYKLGNYLDNTSPYVGGGDSATTWTTTINGIDVGGEWLQVQIPYATYVHQYSIYTPIQSSYPYLFTVVGSNDGVTWNYIDQQNEAMSYFDVANSVNVMTFKVNSTDKYSYFRLVITEISKYTPFIQICSWSIIGGTKLKNITEMESRIINPIKTTPAKSVSKEAFTSLHRSMESRVHRPVFSRIDRHIDRHIDRDHNYLGYIRGNYYNDRYINDYLRGDIIYDDIIVARQRTDIIPLYLSATLGIVTLSLLMVHLSINK